MDTQEENENAQRSVVGFCSTNNVTCQHHHMKEKYTKNLISPGPVTMTTIHSVHLYSTVSHICVSYRVTRWIGSWVGENDDMKTVGNRNAHRTPTPTHVPTEHTYTEKPTPFGVGCKKLLKVKPKPYFRKKPYNIGLELIKNVKNKWQTENTWGLGQSHTRT